MRTVTLILLVLVSLVACSGSGPAPVPTPETRVTPVRVAVFVQGAVLNQAIQLDNGQVANAPYLDRTGYQVVRLQVTEPVASRELDRNLLFPGQVLVASVNRNQLYGVALFDEIELVCWYTVRAIVSGPGAGQQQERFTSCDLLQNHGPYALDVEP